jgi:DNA-binding NtrC family response regulator
MAHNVQGALPRVLVVDDEPAMRLAIEAVLDDDCAVTTAPDAPAALGALAAAAFDVVLSDYEMPGGSGLALLREVHARYPGCVGILVTGHAEHPEVKAVRANPREFHVLIKPYDPQNLLSMVKNAARIARLRQATLKMASQIGKT